MRIRLALMCVMTAAPQLVLAKPGELRPTRGASPDGDGLSKIEHPGIGEPPEDGDEITFRYDVFADRDPAQVTHVAETRRMTDDDAGARLRETLAKMKAGEVRWSWFSAQDGSLCDHFGCNGGPTAYAAKLELVSIQRHHDELPDGLHVTAWPFLGVRQGKRWAALAAEQVAELDEVRVVGGQVNIDWAAKRSGLHPYRAHAAWSLDALRARLEDSDAMAALKHKRWKVAEAAAARAIALDGSLDVAYLHRAAAQVALHEPPQGLEVVAARNPAGMYWRVMADDALAGLRSNAAIRGLVVSVAGELDLEEALYRCTDASHGVNPSQSCVGAAVEPSDRFVLAYASNVESADAGFASGALRVIDRQNGTVIDTLPLDDGNTSDVHDGTPRCARCKQLLAAKKLVHDLGFRAPPATRVVIDYLDKRGWSERPHVVFSDAKLELALAADQRSTMNPFVAIAPPAQTKVTAATLIGDLVIYRWATQVSTTDVVAFRRPKGASPAGGL